MSDKIVLIDGHSILNRAFYGVPELTNGEGLHTNAVYGFLNILFKILEEEKPQYLAVAFDVNKKTFRHAIYTEYKGTRKPMPEELREQVPVMKELLRAMGILTVEQEGLEADDILGTIAKISEANGMEVSLVSGDRDLLQIATDHIQIRIPKTKGNHTEIENYYAKDVVEAYGVDPITFIDLKALMGDTADNIPGVPKVGQKTATELLVSYGSLAGVYRNVEEISKKSIKESLIANKDLADLSKVLATIKIDAEFSFSKTFPKSLEQARIQNFYTPEAYTIFKRLEFKNYLSRFDKDAQFSDAEKKSVSEYKLQVVDTVERLSELTDRFSVKKWISVAYTLIPKNETGLKNEIGGQLSFDFSEPKERALYLICAGEREVYLLDSARFEQDRIRVALGSLLFEEGPVFVCHDVKKFYPMLELDRNKKSSKISSHFFDASIAAYLLNPLKSAYFPEDIAADFGKVSIKGYTERFGKADPSDVLSQKENEYISYLKDVAAAYYEVYEELQKCLSEQGMQAVYEEIEMPLSYILYDMEQEGIRIMPEELKKYGDQLAEKIAILEKSVYEQAGEEFNINSPKQLAEILFEKMHLEGGKKTKTGYSTAADVLEKLAPANPIVRDILEYRGLSKLKSTYADGLAAFIEENDRIHSTFNQTITATGRISSTEPNLQNIPMRTQQGRLIRKVFIPKDGYLFMDADYSQIELRILAHMSDDQELIKAYKEDQDIHRITASKVFHTPFEEVTDLQRRNAKAVNFGIVYGISSFGLSQDLSISRKEATEYIEEYFKTYPGIKNYLDNCVEGAKTKGYSTTLYGRRRPIPELSSSNFMQRQFGERIAMNAPIQGTAADIIKIAMIRVYDRLKEEKCKSKMILQIHDELLIETEKNEAEQVQKILEEEMKNAAQLKVELLVDLHVGQDWYEAKG